MKGESIPVNEYLQLAETGLNQAMLPVFLGILFAAAIAWLFLSRRLYELLRHDYPQIYETLGSPKLFMQNSLTTNYRVIRYILRRNFESTGSPEVIRLCSGLRYIFIIYIVCFAGSIILLLDRMA